MLTTKQVRAIIHQHTDNTYGIYTNKTTGDTSNMRRVKCYFRNNTKLLRALQKAAGKQYVTLTEGAQHYYSGGPGIIVECILDGTEPAPF
jgi:hypothetical protein